MVTSQDNPTLAANAGPSSETAHPTPSAGQFFTTARHSSENEGLNMIWPGSHALASKLVQAFLATRFSGAECHRRRLAKIAILDYPANAFRV